MPTRSEQLFTEPQRHLVGGFTSAVRAFRSVGGTPVFYRRGEGAWLEDVDGQRYVDYVLSYGPLAVGHAHPDLVSTISETAALGTSFGAPSEHETRLAHAVKALMPCIKRIRMVNSRPRPA